MPEGTAGSSMPSSDWAQPSFAYDGSVHSLANPEEPISGLLGLSVDDSKLSRE